MVKSHFAIISGIFASSASLFCKFMTHVDEIEFYIGTNIVSILSIFLLMI